MKCILLLFRNCFSGTFAVLVLLFARRFCSCGALRRPLPFERGAAARDFFVIKSNWRLSYTTRGTTSSRKSSSYLVSLQQPMVTSSHETSDVLESDLYLAPTSTQEDMSARLSRHKPSLDTWVRRLNTREDKFAVHKISNLLFVVSSTVILVEGCLSIFQGMPPWMALFDSMLFYSTVGQCMSSVLMAVEFRRNDPALGWGFIANAQFCMLVELMCAYLGPFQPLALLHNKSVFDLVMLAFSIFCFASTAYTLQQSDFIFKAKSEGKNRSDSLEFEATNVLTWFRWDAFGYFAGFLPGTVVLLYCTILLIDPAHDRQFFLDRFQDGHLPGSPTQSEIYYLSVLVNIALSYSALVTTLRDKKLVSKEVEVTVLNLGNFMAFAPVVWILLF